MIPVVLFVFNRPDKTQRTLLALREQTVRPARMIVFADDARTAEEAQQAEAVRGLIRGIHWTSVQLIERDRNYGCAPNILDGLTQVLAEHEAAVVLEDDTCPARSFYEAMLRLLEHYCAAEQVFSVGGYPHLLAGALPGYPFDVILSPRFSCWGWGTWANRWKAVKPALAAFRNPFGMPEAVPDTAGTDLPAAARLLDARPQFYWDLQLSLLALHRGLLHAHTRRYLVNNIGTDSGVHGQAGRDTAFYRENNIMFEGVPVRLPPPAPQPEAAEAVREYVLTAMGMATPGPSGVTGAIKRAVKRMLPTRLKDTLKRLGTPAPSGPVYGLKEFLPPGVEPRHALLSYVTWPFRAGSDAPCHLQFSNGGIARNLARALNELGYVVDVIDWNDTRVEARRDYDLCLYHGGANLNDLPLSMPRTVCIYFATGMHWREHNRRAEERCRQLAERRGARLPPDRPIMQNEDPACSGADGILALGDERARASFPHRLVLSLNNAAYPDDRFERMAKDYAASRRNFLFFSGKGNVHKGLDLLLDAFARSRAHLYICQGIQPQFSALYRHELQDMPNIHWVGPIALRGSTFYELIDQCAYAISASCSEGSQGAIVECLHQGLIPVLPLSDATLSTAAFDTVLPEAVEEMARKVDDLAQRTPAWCEEQSHRARRLAVEEFSEEAFLARARAGIAQIVKESKKG